MSEQTPKQSTGLSDMPTEPRSCGAHGVYESRNVFANIWTRCPVCEKDAHAKKMAEQEDIAKERRSEAIRGIMRRSGIPPRFAGRSFENYRAGDEKQMRILRVCRAYAERFEDRLSNGGGLVMCGQPGTGKTHLACAIAQSIASMGRASLFVSAIAAVRRVKETYRKGSEETESDAINLFRQPDLLIIDEIGVQFGSDTEKMILFEIINSRYEWMRPTILISNLTEGELSAFVGERAMDRMKEGGGAVLAFDWPSVRAETRHEAEPAKEVNWDRLAERLL